MASPGAEPPLQQEAEPPAEPVYGAPAQPVGTPTSANHVILENFFQCGAQELALNLIGRLLHIHDDGIGGRILETEAYPEGDGVYNRRFPDAVQARFRALKGGTLLAWSSSDTIFKSEFKHIYISAGPVGTGDVVLLRSCEPIIGLEELLVRRKATNTTARTQKNLLINPLLLSAGIGGDRWKFTTDPILYRGDGAQVLPGFLMDYERMTYGTRVSKEDGVEGADSMLRFALWTPMFYGYEKKTSLVPYTAPV